MSARVTEFEIRCGGCGATKRLPPPIRRRTADGWVSGGQRGWRCPACRSEAVVCLYGDCQRTDVLTGDELARKQSASGWKRRVAGWVCPTCRLTKKQKRGFASMDPAQQARIAAKGGRAAHRAGTAHEWSAEEARKAGQKGGHASNGGRGKHTRVQQTA